MYSIRPTIIDAGLSILVTVAPPDSGARAQKEDQHA